MSTTDPQCGACRYGLDQHSMSDPACDHYEDPVLKAESVELFNAERFPGRAVTAADQPTTEPSEGVVVEAVAKALADDWNPDRDPVLTAMFRDYAQTAVTAAAGLLALAPLPAADTETEVQWGVRVGDGPITLMPWPPTLAALVRLRGDGKTIVRRAATYTPWEEA